MMEEALFIPGTLSAENPRIDPLERVFFLAIHTSPTALRIVPAIPNPRVISVSLPPRASATFISRFQNMCDSPRSRYSTRCKWTEWIGRPDRGWHMDGLGALLSHRGSWPFLVSILSWGYSFLRFNAPWKLDASPHVSWWSTPAAVK